MIAGVRAWRVAGGTVQREWLIVLLASDASVNLLWSLLFFRLQRPDSALLEVGVLWSSALALTIVVRRCDFTGDVVLLPTCCGSRSRRSST